MIRALAVLLLFASPAVAELSAQWSHASAPGGQFEGGYTGKGGEFINYSCTSFSHYFPRDSVRSEYLVESTRQSVCPWKGTASYYSLNVNGETNADAAWFYPAPKSAAAEIKDRIAFWRGVKVA